MSRVSVVIPCFNYGRYLPEAVESVIAQTYRDWELLIVDDGSTDGSEAVARSLVAAHRSAPMRLVARPHSGLPGPTRNTGIRLADTEYVLCLDADDLLEPRFLEHCVRALDDQPGFSIAYGGQQNFGDDGTFHPHGPYDFRTLTCANQIGTASLFRRRAWQEVGGYPSTASHEDWDFWVGCGERGHYGVHVPEAIFRYRVHPGGLFEEGTRRDAEHKARVVANHPGLYTRLQRSWADAVLAGDPRALALPTALGAIPRFVGDDEVPDVSPRGPLASRLETREAVTLALVEELVDDPLLLRAYAAAVAPDDDATLVVLPTRAGDVAGRVVDAAAAAGVDLESGPDVLLVPNPLAPAQLRALAFTATAFLSRRTAPADLAAAPFFDVDAAFAAAA